MRVPGGAAGVQACTAAGTFGPCDCGPPVDAGGLDASTPGDGSTGHPDTGAPSLPPVFSGSCSWSGTITSSATLQVAGVDRNNDFYYRAGEELRRIRCEGGEVDGEPIELGWNVGGIAGTALVLESSRDGMSLRLRRYTTREVLWTRPFIFGTGGLAMPLGTSGMTLVQDQVDEATGEYASTVEAIDERGATAWRVELPAGASVVSYPRSSRDGHWLISVEETFEDLTTRGPRTLMVMDLAGAEVYRYRFDPADWGTDLTSTTLNGYALGPGGALGLLISTYPDHTMAVIEAPGVVTRRTTFSASLRNVFWRGAITSEGILAFALAPFGALPGSSHAGSHDFGMVAMGRAGTLLWTFQRGSGGDERGQDEVFTDDRGDLLSRMSPGSTSTVARTIFRLDPQTGRERGVAVSTAGACSGPTDFNGVLGSPCTPSVSFPLYDCSATDPPIAARCDAATCRWVGETCTAPAGCTAVCSGVGCGGRCPVPGPSGS